MRIARAKRPLFGGRLAAFLGALFLVSMAFAARVSKTDSSGEQIAGVQTVTLPGVLSDINRVALTADGRYALVAPFAPVVDGDNHFVDVMDLSNPSAGPTAIDIGNYYYPTGLVVGQDNRVFVRVTGLPSSGTTPNEGILVFRLDTSGKQPAPDGENFTFYRIDPPTGSTDSSVIPVDFGLGGEGKILVFTNGESIHLVTLAEGYSYEVNLVAPGHYKPLADPHDTTDDYLEITRLDVDPHTDIITVTVNGRSQGKNFSQLFFYQMYESGPNYGTVDLLKLVNADQFPAGTSMTPGSNAISPDGEFGYFVVDDGSLCRVALQGKITNAQVEVLGSYESLASGDLANRGPRLVQYDKPSGTIGLVNRGHVVDVRRPGGITRPSYVSRRVRITRPSYITIDEPPGLVLANLADDGTVADARAFSNFGDGEIGISNIAFDTNGGALLTNYSGDLLLVNQDGLSNLGQSVARVDQLAPTPDGSALVGVSSFSFDPDGNLDPAEPGSLVIINLNDPSVPEEQSP